MEADVGAAVGVEVRRGGHEDDRLAQPGEVGGGRALGRQDRGARLERAAQPERRPEVVRQRVAGRAGGQGRLGHHEGPAAAAADGLQVPALDERRDRLAQGRAGDAELLGQLALGRQPRARAEDAEPDRRAQPLDGLLERRRRLHGLEDRGDRGAGTLTHGRTLPAGPPAQWVRGALSVPARAGVAPWGHGRLDPPPDRPLPHPHRP